MKRLKELMTNIFGTATTAATAQSIRRELRDVGEQVAVTQASLNQNRDYPVLNDYRAVLGGVFRRLYGLDDARLAQVFPGTRSRDIGLV